MTEAVRRSMRSEAPENADDVYRGDGRSGRRPHGADQRRQGFEVGAVNPKSTEPQAVQVAYQDSQGQPARFQVQCIVSERPQVPVLAHSVATGDVIHESDLAWQPVDSTTGLLTRLDEIVNKEAKRSLHADEPIQADDVRNVPLVRANDIVTGIWHSGGIRITGQFKAKGDGGLGDVITIVKLTGQDKLTARVTDVHEAEIVMPIGRSPTADGTAAKTPALTSRRGGVARRGRRLKPPRQADGKHRFAGDLCRATINRVFLGGLTMRNLVLTAVLLTFLLPTARAAERSVEPLLPPGDGRRPDRPRVGWSAGDHRPRRPTFMLRSRRC